MKENHQIDSIQEIDEETKKIEEILGIKPGEDHKKSDYIQELYLTDVILDDFSKFLPYLNKVRKVNLTNCTISNFSELLKLDRCSIFYLDNVTFRNSDCNIIRDFPHNVRFSNMNFDASCMNGIKAQASGSMNGYKHLYIKNCHVDNIQELSTIEDLYSLDLDKITFTHHPRKIKEKSICMIDISNSQFEDISFIPFKKIVTDIDFTNCHIGSFEGISEFKKLEKIKICTNTTVEEIKELENPFNRKMICHFVKEQKEFRLKNIVALKNYIDELRFTDFKEKTIDNIEKFEKVKNLSFEKSKFYVDAFLPIAKQIESIDVRDSEIKKHTYLKHFPNLIKFDSTYFEKESKDIRNFFKLLPLKKQLKELYFYESDDIHDMQKKLENYPVEHFTELETLDIGYEVSVKTAESILKLKKLKKLDISIEKSKKVFYLGNLKKLEFLIFNSRVKFTGFENLKRLKSLQIVNDKKFDVRTLPEMKSLKRLNFYGDDCNVKGMSRFPNLEFLKIQSVKKLNLKTLKKLKVLSLGNSEIKDFSLFEMLPSLEKLDLSNLQNNINLKEISKFPNLKWLTFLESEYLDDISGVEALKKLERLDLYKTKVTDVKVLNTLPNLKEVNLAVQDYALKNLEQQLDRHEIGIYSGVPRLNLWVWEKDEFGI